MNTYNARRRTIATVASVGAAGAALVLLAACSSSAGYGSGPASSGPASNAPLSNGALATRDISNVGKVLVDPTGKTLYTAAQEAGGKILCTGSCLAIWVPVTSSADVAAPSGVPGTIASMKRSDNGQTQLTYNGAPVYTFAEDMSPGDAKGNNAKDSFGSNHFTWHAVVVSGAPSASSAPTSSDNGAGGGYGGGY